MDSVSLSLLHTDGQKQHQSLETSLVTGPPQPLIKKQAPEMQQREKDRGEELGAGGQPEDTARSGIRRRAAAAPDPGVLL